MIKKVVPGKRRRGIYLLPNLFTTAALFSGFYAIVAAMHSHFESAAIAVFVAMVLDGIDGRVARLTNTQTDFGAEYDSLADMASFGLAPALVVYEWALSDLGKLGWLAAFIFAASAALRLARFNTQVGIADKRYFQGLPSPSAAAIVAGLVWVGESHNLTGQAIELVALVLTVFAGLLMVSNVRYYSFKSLPMKDRVPFVAILLIVLIIVLISTNPPLMLFATFFLYAISGLVATLIQLRKRRAERHDKHSESGTADNAEASEDKQADNLENP